MPGQPRTPPSRHRPLSREERPNRHANNHANYPGPSRKAPDSFTSHPRPLPAAPREAPYSYSSRTQPAQAPGNATQHTRLADSVGTLPNQALQAAEPVRPLHRTPGLFTKEDRHTIDDMIAMADDDDHMIVDESALLSPGLDPSRVTPPIGWYERDPLPTRLQMPIATPFFAPASTHPDTTFARTNPLPAPGNPFQPPQMTTRHGPVPTQPLAHQPIPRPLSRRSHRPAAQDPTLRRQAPLEDLSDSSEGEQDEEGNEEEGPIPAMNIPRTALTTFKHTETPKGGWRPIQGSTPSWRTENVRRRQVEAWGKDTAYSVLVQEIGKGACDNNATDRARLEEEVTSRFLDNPVKVQLTEAEVPPSAKNRFPFYRRMLVQSAEDQKRLIEQGVLSTPDITMQFEPLANELPTHVATYRQANCFGVTMTASDEELEKTVEKAVRMMLSRPEVKATIIETIEQDSTPERPGRWSNKTPKKAFRYIRRTVKAIVTKKELPSGEHETLVAVYCQSPTTDPGCWKVFRDWFRSLPFGSDAGGRPIVFEGTLWCALCHTTDHDTGGCYMARVNGFFGEVPNKLTGQKNQAYRGGPPKRGRGGMNKVYEPRTTNQGGRGGGPVRHGAR